MSIQLIDDEEMVWQSYQAKVIRHSRFLVLFLVFAVANGLVWYAAKHIALTESRAWQFGLVAGFVSAVYLAYVFFLKMRRPIYMITTKRVVIYNGIFNRDILSEYLDRILDVEFQQTFSQRVFGVGTLYIRTAIESSRKDAATLADTPHFADIDDAERVYNLLMEARENYRGRRGN